MMTLVSTPARPALWAPASPAPLRRQLRALALPGIATLLLAWPAAAQDRPVVVQSVEPETAAVKLRAVYRQFGARSGPASGAFTMKATKADLGLVRLIPDSAAGPALALDSASVTLRKDTPVRLRFTLSGVTAPGTYRSRVRVKHATRDSTIAEFGVEVLVTSTPKVDQPAGVNSTFSMVRRPLGPADPVVRWLFPVELRGETQAIALENKTEGGVFVAETPVPILRSERNGVQFPTAVELLAPREGPAVEGPELPVSLRFHPERLAPGKYVGQVPLPFAGSALPHKVATFTLNVRAGWLLPLLLIVAGVVVGRVAQLFNLPLARMQEELLGRVFRQQARASALDDAQIREHFGSALDGMVRSIENASAETERAGIEERLAVISSSMTMMETLMGLRRRIKASNRPDRVDLLARADDVGARVLGGDVAGATTQLQALQQAIATPSPNVAAAAAADASLPAETAAFTRRFQAAVAAHERRSGPGGFFPLRLGSAEWRYRYLRPAFLWALVAGVAVMGFYTLYVNDPVFGAQGLYDYGKCFLWGLGTDVATKTLQALSLPRLSLAGG